MLAQSLKAEATVGSKESASFIFRMISWGSEPLSGITLRTGGEIQHLHAPIDQRSEEFYYCGTKDLIFYDSSLKEGKGVPVARVTARDQWREMLFLGQYVAETAVLNLYAIDDSEAAHPQNSIRLINLSGRPLGGLVGRQEVVLNEGRDHVVPATNTGEFISIQFACKTTRSTKWERFMSTAIEARQNGRILIVFYPSEQDDPSGEREVSFKLYSDFPNTKKISRLN